MVDAHCHIPQLNGEGPAACIEHANALGVRRIGAVSEKRSEWGTLIDLKQRYPTIVDVGIGLHPCPGNNFTL